MQKPDTSDYDDYYNQYIDLVSGDNLLEILVENQEDTQDLIESIPDVKAEYRYAEGKWSVKEVLVHLMDTERVFNYRALMIARNDKLPLPGYDHNEFVQSSKTDERSLDSIAEEFIMVRNATIALFANLSDNVLDNKGVANNKEITVRAIGYLIAGHELHHLNVIREKYLS